MGSEGVGFDDIPVVHEFHRSFKQAGNLSGTVPNKEITFFTMKVSLIQMVGMRSLLHVDFGLSRSEGMYDLSDSQRAKPFQEAKGLIF